MRFYLLSVFISFLFFTSCSSIGTVTPIEELDLIAQVLKNYEPDLRYCVSLTDTKDEYVADFLLLPSGLVFSSKISTKSGRNNVTTGCMEHILNRVIFPPVKDKVAKQIKRELVFTEIK